LAEHRPLHHHRRPARHLWAFEASPTSGIGLAQDGPALLPFRGNSCDPRNLRTMTEATMTIKRDINGSPKTLCPLELMQPLCTATTSMRQDIANSNEGHHRDKSKQRSGRAPRSILWLQKAVLSLVGPGQIGLTRFQPTHQRLPLRLA
jgi:hypothetical protein